MNQKLKRLSLLTSLVALPLMAQDSEFEIKVDDFVSLYNKHRYGQPQRSPWAGSYFAFGTNGIAEKMADGSSPTKKYDKLFRASSDEWEMDAHSCKNMSGEEKKSCEGWWGHCNAWSSAAIKEAEPRKPISYKGENFGVGEQKAYLTELWMDSGSLFTGNTNKAVKTGKWVYDPMSATARESEYGVTNWEAFWDVTPKTFFLLFTNYMGIMKQGLVIDRFAGDEVWNQPVVGYAFMPLSEENILQPIVKNSKKIYPVKLTVKLYWANDGVEADHVSKIFDIKKMSLDSSVMDSRLDPDFDGITLGMKLFFDAPVELDANGKLKGKASFVGEGVWAHQEEKLSTADELNSTHPDFVWMPTDLSVSSDSRNPEITARNVEKIMSGSSSSGGDGEPSRPEVGSEFVEFELSLRLLGVSADDFDAAQIKAMVDRELRPAGYKYRLKSADIELVGRSKVKIRMKVLDGSDADKIKTVIEEAYRG